MNHYPFALARFFSKLLEQRRAQLTERTHSTGTVEYIALFLLAITMFSVHIPISFFGASISDPSALREMLLIIQSSIQMFRLFPNFEIQHINELLDVHSELAAGGNEDVLSTLRLRYGLAFQLPKFDPTKRASRRSLLTLNAAILGNAGWSLFAVGFIVVVQLTTVVNIIRHPSVSLTFSLLVTLYVLLVIITSYSFNRIIKLAPDLSR